MTPDIRLLRKINAAYDAALAAARAAGNPATVTLAYMAKKHGVDVRILRNWRGNHWTRDRRKLVPE